MGDTDSRKSVERESDQATVRGDERTAEPRAARRRVLKAALMAAPVILTLKSGPARANGGCHSGGCMSKMTGGYTGASLTNN